MRDSIPTTPSPTADPSGRVQGVFHDRKALVRAVERLAEKSVPADSIRVYVLDQQGNRDREVEVEDESGALRGAIIGAVAGGVLGLLIAVAVALGLAGPVEVGFLSFRGLSGALSSILALAGAAVPLGALLGLGHWQGRKKIDEKELQSGAALVVVDSAELSELARQVLDDAGAEEVEVRE